MRRLSLTGTRMIGVPEAAVRMRVTDRRVRFLLEVKRLPGTRLGRQWVIREEDLAAYLAKKAKHKLTPGERRSRLGR